MTTSSTAKFLDPGRKVLSVLLAVLLFFCPLMQIRASAASLEDILLILWSALRSCGINLVGTATSVVSFLYQEVSDFATAAGSTVTDVLYGLKYSVNSLGEFIINDTFVDFVDDFISYFTSKHNLSNNETKQLSEAIVSLGSIASYALPLQFQEPAYSYYQEYEVYLTPYDVFGVFVRESGSLFHMAFWSDGHSYVQRYAGRLNNMSLKSTYELTETADNGIYWCNATDVTFNGNSYDISGYLTYAWDTVHTAFTELTDDDIAVVGEDITSITTTINAPSGNIAFVAGDGATINIGSNWGSSIYDLFDHIRQLVGSLSNQITIYYHDLSSLQSQLPQPADVENLPAGTIYNINGIYQDSNGDGGIRFGGIWHYVSDWIEDFTEAAPIIWYVVTNSPSQLVNLLYATVVLTIVIGFIHKARSH